MTAPDTLTRSKPFTLAKFGPALTGFIRVARVQYETEPEAQLEAYRVAAWHQHVARVGRHQARLDEIGGLLAKRIAAAKSKPDETDALTALALAWASRIRSYHEGMIAKLEAAYEADIAEAPARLERARVSGKTLEEPSAQQQLAAYRVAETKRFETYRDYQMDQLAAIPARLAEMLAKVERASPRKRGRMIREAVTWADDQRVRLNQAIADREAALVVDLRTVELAVLERARGGEVVIEERSIETPVLKDGALIWEDGKVKTKPEIVRRPRVNDGLDTLANSHLHADGRWRMQRDGKTPMKPVFKNGQLAALIRYREAYKDQREVSLRAVDATEAGGDRTPFDIGRSMTLERMVQSAVSQKREDEAGRSFAKLEGHVSRIAGRDALRVLRDVAGVGHTINSLAPGRRKAIRLTRALLGAADVLAVRFGLVSESRKGGAELMPVVKFVSARPGERVSLANCPPGLFLFEGCVGLKTEYRAMDPVGPVDVPGDQIRWRAGTRTEAYVVQSGEFFWGGAKTREAREKLMVQPLTLGAVA